MKKIITLLSLVLLFVLPLVSFSATQPTSLDKVMEDAAISGVPVEQKTPDGTIYRAIPDYGKSKCRFVFGSAWKDGNLMDKKTKEVCNK